MQRLGCLPRIFDEFRFLIFQSKTGRKSQCCNSTKVLNGSWTWQLTDLWSENGNASGDELTNTNGRSSGLYWKESLVTEGGLIGEQERQRCAEFSEESYFGNEELHCLVVLSHGVTWKEVQNERWNVHVLAFKEVNDDAASKSKAKRDLESYSFTEFSINLRSDCH